MSSQSQSVKGHTSVWVVPCLYKFHNYNNGLVGYRNEAIWIYTLNIGLSIFLNSFVILLTKFSLNYTSVILYIKSTFSGILNYWYD